MTFDEPNLVANSGLVLIATSATRLARETLCDATIDLSGRCRRAPAGEKDPFSWAPPASAGPLWPRSERSIPVATERSWNDLPAVEIRIQIAHVGV